MAFNLLLKRTGVAQKRPDPAFMALGELNLNYNESAGGLYYKDSTNAVRKVGPTHVGPVPPNDLAVGSVGHSVGEAWFDTSTNDFKVWDGTAWVVVSEEGNPIGRMYWDGNTTQTLLSPQSSWHEFVASSPSLGSGAFEFALDTGIMGLRYVGIVTKKMVVTLKGRFDSTPGTSFKVAIAKTTTDTVVPATDIITDSVVSIEDSKLGDVFFCETVVDAESDSVIYPLIQNSSSATSATIKSLSMLIKKV
jgi:hypothetical protein